MHAFTCSGRYNASGENSWSTRSIPIAPNFDVCTRGCDVALLLLKSALTGIDLAPERSIARVRDQNPLGPDNHRRLIVLLTTWGATQWTAWQLGFQPQLGQPWFELAGLPIYYPPAFFWWWYFYDAYAPSVFVEGAYIAASGGFISIAVAIGMSVWRAREARTSRPTARRVGPKRER